ncbi:unnamed protein product [Caenorhabditis sp. 36 PRJEB53466]|nr:unnamed protein product [Caenorhabditis sp. 36 PRJEB53466]
MRAIQRFWVCFTACVITLYLMCVVDNDQIRYPSYENGKLFGFRNNDVIHTKMHNNEYCIAYDFLESTESFREDGLEPITLATHGTSDMIKEMESKPSNWDGPISVGVFLDFHSRDALEYLSDVHRCDKEFRKKVSVHFAFRLSAFQNECPSIRLKKRNITCEEFEKKRSQMRKTITAPFQLYPSNLMRNIARHGAKSEIHFLADADMEFSEGFATRVKKIANEMVDGRNKNVLVVRRFEYENITELPENHVELKQMMDRKQIFEFHHKFFFSGHQIKNISYWFNVSDSHKEVVAWQIPYASNLWEVQVILHRNDLYNADYFPARIKVMQSLIYSLCRANYTFHLLSHVFDLHEGVKLADTDYSKAVIAHGRKFGRSKAHNRFRKETDELYPKTEKRCEKFVM